MHTVFPRPAVIGTVSPENMQHIAELSTAFGTFDEFDDDARLNVELSHNGAVAVEPLEGSRYSIDTQKVSDAISPILAIAGSWLVSTAATPLRISINHGLIEPGRQQRLGQWHQDSAEDPTYRAISLATPNPTEFAVGRLHGKLQEEFVENPDKDVSFYNTIYEKALACGQLAITPVGEALDVIAFDSRHVHRSPKMTGTGPQQRTFIRIATSPRIE